MKTKIIILFLIIPILGISQKYNSSCLMAKKGRHENLKVTSLLAASVVLNAIGEGSSINGDKALLYASNAVSIACLLLIPVVSDINNKSWYKYMIKYGLIRFSLLSPIINATIGEPVYYIRDSSGTDNILKKINPNPDLDIVFRSVYLAVGVWIPLDFNKSKYYK